MFDIGGGELLLIILVILVLFGPKKIPEIAQMVGKGMRKVKEAQAQFQTQINALEHEIKAPLNEIKNEYENMNPLNKSIDNQQHNVTLSEVEGSYPLVDSIDNLPLNSNPNEITTHENEPLKNVENNK
jgi:sec-independent protein translocase protein TatA